MNPNSGEFQANAILYHTLDISLQLGEALGDHSLDNVWRSAMHGIKAAVNGQLWDPTHNLFFDNDANQTAAAVHPQDGNSWAIMAGLVDAKRAADISAALQNRWVRPYGAPAPEAGATVSPFASGFELQAHFLAGFPERSIDLIEFMWADFMLDDPRMTNSSLIEGYSTNGDLHYAPYSNDDRISHAHGWATSPTSSLTFYAAGLQIMSAAGKKWKMQPQLGGLKRVESGYQTPLGQFSALWKTDDSSGAVTGTFKTPSATSGTLILSCKPATVVVRGPNGIVKPTSSTDGLRFEDLPGGHYSVRLK